MQENLSRSLLGDNERISSPAEYPGVTQQLSENLILTTVDDLYDWDGFLAYGQCFIVQPAALLNSQR